MSNPIGWCDETLNPIVGCSKVSPACTNCYAERMAVRQVAMGNYPPEIIKDSHWSGKVAFRPEQLEKVLRWRKPQRVFVCSMGDLFHEDLTNHEIERVFAAICRAYERGHTWLLLTKRPKRACEWFSWAKDRQPGWFSPFTGRLDLGDVWLGATIENQEYARDRLGWLFSSPVGQLFASYEPALGPLNLTRVEVLPEEGYQPGVWLNALTGHAIGPDDMLPQKLSWVICGGETGPGARPLHPDWARSLRDQCQTAGVPFFFKQWGAWIPRSQWRHARLSPWGTLTANGTYFDSTTPWNGHYDDGLGDREAVVLRVGKKAAGHLLDGKEYREFPS